MIRVEAIVDGGMIGGNPGKGGWGGRFRVYNDEHSYNKTLIDEKFFGFSFGTEVVTNNVAEWRAILGAMQIFHEYYSDVESWTIISDSKLAVMQAKGKWQCKDEHLKQLYFMYQQLWISLTALGNIPFTIEHRRREHTMVAHDHIAKILGRSK
jgi:ribonuclease HI